MQTENRSAPHLMLGVLTLLSLGAIVLSLNSSPPNAQEQLRTAAANAAAASSFILTDTETAGPADAGSTNHEEAVIAYQAPDRVEETVMAGGRTGSVLVIGSHRYERNTSSGKWYDLGPVASGSSTQSAGELAASDILYPVQSLTSAVDVTGSGQSYRFQPGQPQLLLSRLFGTAQPSGSPSYLARVSGEFVSLERISVTGSAEQVTIDLALSHVNRGPALSAPPPSQLTKTPPS